MHSTECSEGSTLFGHGNSMQVEDYVNDKLNFVGPVRSRTANEILKGFRAVGRRHSELALPILAVHGTSDHCTSLPVCSVCSDHQSIIKCVLLQILALNCVC